MSDIPFKDRLSCTINEARAATGIGRSTLYLEIGAGRLESTCVRGRRVVLVPSLLRLLGARDSAPDNSQAA
jgi:hypothetical protein